MFRKTVSAIMLSLLVISTLTLAIKIQSVKADYGTIYINADGSITPSTTPIYSIDNVTYTLTGNVSYPTYEGIVVERNNIVIDGNGFMLSGSSSAGIGVAGVTNVTIRNINIIGFYQGVSLNFSSNCTVSNSNITGKWARAVLSIGINIVGANYSTLLNNNVSNCLLGIRFSNSSGNFLVNSSIEDCEMSIRLEDSPDNNIFGNTIVNTFGMWGGMVFSYSPNNIVSGNTLTNASISVDGKTLDDFMQSIDSSNIIDGKNAYYITNQNGLILSPLTHPLICILGVINSTGITIKDFTLSNILFLIAYTNDSGITNCTLMGDVSFTASSYNYISNSTLTGSISLNASSNNQITSLTAYSVSLSDNSCQNTIADSNISGSDIGSSSIDIDSSSSRNLVAKNNVLGRPFEHIGINVYSEYNNILGNNVVSGSPPSFEEEGLGIGVALAPNNVMTGNSIVNCTIGIATEDFNIIERNSITGCGYGVISFYENDQGSGFPAQCSGVVVSGNNITNCSSGIRLDGFLNCTIVGNNIESNQDGLDAFGAWNNTEIYHNNFINNTIQANNNNNGGGNVWDNGYPSGGNYWSDYNSTDAYSGPYQNISGSDGIGDTPYVIDANNTDIYPLMSPWTQLVGDLNGDGKVGLDDLILMAAAYGTTPASGGIPGDLHAWNPNADIAPPYGVIELTDIVTLAMHYGQHYP